MKGRIGDRSFELEQPVEREARPSKKKTIGQASRGSELGKRNSGPKKAKGEMGKKQSVSGMPRRR